MDMLMQPFNLATLQNIRAFLEVHHPGETASEMIGAIDRHINAIQPPVEIIDRGHNVGSDKIPPICPSCTRGKRMRWAINNDGLAIAVCPACRYSEVI